MPRSLSIALIASLCLTVTGRAEDPDPRKIPSVKKALERGQADIRKNRKDYDEANAKTVAEVEKVLKEEVDALAKAGKLEEAIAVKKLAQSLKDELVEGGGASQKKDDSKRRVSDVKKQPNPAQAGAVRWNGHRYKAFQEPCRWDEAKKRCEDMGGHLVVIETAEEQNALSNLLVQAGLGKDQLWIGASDEAQEGLWKWVDGSPVAYMNWLPREPNNLGGEHYAVMSMVEGGRWNDSPLREKRWFICEWDE